MITKEDIRVQFENETGMKYSFSLFGYFQWLEKMYINKLNEEKELNDEITEFML